MIELEDGLTLSGRCIWGMKVGYILTVGRRTYTIRWIDGETTTQLRPDHFFDDNEMMEAAE